MSNNKIVHSNNGMRFLIDDQGSTDEISKLKGVVGGVDNKYLEISGNVKFLNNIEISGSSNALTISGTIEATSFTGSLEGNASTASRVLVTSPGDYFTKYVTMVDPSEVAPGYNRTLYQQTNFKFTGGDTLWSDYFKGNGYMLTNLQTSNITDFTTNVRSQFTAGTDIGISSGVISFTGSSGDVFLSSNNTYSGINTFNSSVRVYSYLITGDSTESTTGIRPTDDDYFNLGNSSYRWNDIWATNTSINSTSDERRKELIEDIPHGIEFVNNLRPVQYKWKDYVHTKEDGTTIDKKFKRKHFGIIAQELKDTLEQKDISTDDFAAYIYDSDSDSYAIRYGEFIPILIKSAQQLSKENKDLKSRIEVLETLVASILG